MSDLRREPVNNFEGSKHRDTMHFSDEFQQVSVTLRYELHPLRCLATSTFAAKRWQHVEPHAGKAQLQALIRQRVQAESFQRCPAARD
jgi:hypothetical protein